LLQIRSKIAAIRCSPPIHIDRHERVTSADADTPIAIRTPLAIRVFE